MSSWRMPERLWQAAKVCPERSHQPTLHFEICSATHLIFEREPAERNGIGDEDTLRRSSAVRDLKVV